MKKQLSILLIFVFVFGLIPVNFTKAITQNQINAEVQIVCTDGNDNWFSGSGTIIDPKGIILTNRHVVEGAYMDVCFVGFIRSINQEPDFGTENNPNFAEVKYKTTSDDMDAAILYLDNPNNISYSYVDIWNSNSDTLQFGNKIEVIGYPNIGGSTITYTSGDFSGFGSSLNQTENYIKTTAPLEHGNSGGAAYNSNGQFVGIPTMVIPGELNSLSYILSINSLKKWLSSKLGFDYKNEIIQKKAETENLDLNIQNDITPPKVDRTYWHSKIYSDKNKTQEYNFSNTFNDDSVYIEWPVAEDKNGIKGYYVYWGFDINVNPVVDGQFQKDNNVSKTCSTKNTYYLIIQAQDNYGNLSERVILPYNYGVLPDWVENDPLQYGIVTNRPENIYIYDYSNGEKGELLKSLKFDSSKVQDISISSNNIYIEWDGVNNRNFITKVKIRFDKGRTWDKCGGHWVNLDPSSQEYINWDICFRNEEEKQYNTVENNYITATKLDVGSNYNFEFQYYYTYEGHVNDMAGFFHIFNLKPTKYKNLKSNNLSNRLKGRLLLQVEQGGSIWYVDTNEYKKYSVTWSNALPLFQKLSLGITNTDLEKIPIFGSNSTGSTSMRNRLKGKLLLQVEQGGNIWFVDKDGFRHSVTWNNLMPLFEGLALGITNNDLSKIQVGSLDGF